MNLSQTPKELLILILQCISYFISLYTLSNLVPTWIMFWRARGYIKKLIGDVRNGVDIYIPLRKNYERNKSVIASEDLVAVLTLIRMFEAYKIKTKIKFISEHSQPEIDKNSVFICGPKSSSYVENFIKKDLRFCFKEVDGTWFIHDKVSSVDYMSPVDKNKDDQRDLGYVGSFKKSNFNILIIAGIHAAGSVGVCEYISNVKEARKILNTKRNSFFSFIVCSKYSGDPLEIHKATLHTSIEFRLES